jgi:hypothetical protein
VDDSLPVSSHQYLENALGNPEHFGLKQTTAGALAPFSERLSEQELHDKEGGAAFQNVVVKNDYRARVPHPIGEIPLAQKSPLRRRVQRSVRMRNFDCDAEAIVVRGFEDCGSASDADESLDAPFGAQRPSDPRLCEA